MMNNEPVDFVVLVLDLSIDNWVLNSGLGNDMNRTRIVDQRSQAVKLSGSLVDRRAGNT